MIGGTAYDQCPVYRCAVPPHRVSRFDQLDARRVSAVGPTFEAAFQGHMAAWRLDGKPRTACRFSVYQNCPLPTPEDRLFFILTYLKTYALQVVQGRLFGMGQSKANQWIHVLLPALLAALRTLGDAPARSLSALAQRLGVSEADAASVVAPLEETAAPEVVAPGAAPDVPLWLCRKSPKTGKLRLPRH